jgi:L-ribulokinase
VLEDRFEPVPEHVRVYDRLYAQYRKLHDAFGKPGESQDLFSVMKELLSIRDEVRSS